MATLTLLFLHGFLALVLASDPIVQIRRPPGLHLRPNYDRRPWRTGPRPPPSLHSTPDLIDESSEEATCNCPPQYFEEDSGVLKSPNYPDPYCHDADCEYIIPSGPAGTGIELEFEGEPQVETDFDYVKIHALPPDGKPQLLAKVPGFGGQGISMGNRHFSVVGAGMYLQFISDSSNAERGWMANYRRFNISDSRCHCPPSVYNMTTFAPLTISSPTATDCSSLICFYIFKAEIGKSIELVFNSHSAARLPIIADGNDTTNRANWIHRPPPDSSPPPAPIGWNTTFTSRSHYLSLVYGGAAEAADNANNTFSATLRLVPSVCHCGPSVLGSTSGSLVSPNFLKGACPDLDCTWHFRAEKGSALQLEFHRAFESDGNLISLFLDEGGEQTTLLQKRLQISLRNAEDEVVGIGPSMHGNWTLPQGAARLTLKTRDSLTGPIAGFNVSWRSIPLPADCGCPVPQAGRLVFRECGPLDCVVVVDPPSRDTAKRYTASLTSALPNWAHGASSLRLGQGMRNDSRSKIVNIGRMGLGRQEWSPGKDESLVFLFHSERRAPDPDKSGMSLSFLWDEQDCSCGRSEVLLGVVDKVESWSSPNYPNAYCPSMDCRLVIKARDGMRIRVNVSAFDSEQGGHDFLAFYDGAKPTRRGLLKSLSGPISSRLSAPPSREASYEEEDTSNPFSAGPSDEEEAGSVAAFVTGKAKGRWHSLESSSHILTILFHTDSSVEATGFTLTYAMYRVEDKTTTTTVASVDATQETKAALEAPAQAASGGGGSLAMFGGVVIGILTSVLVVVGLVWLRRTDRCAGLPSIPLPKLVYTHPKPRSDNGFDNEVYLQDDRI